ncbi:hypothetical protein [Halococcus saccharolyticus]|uniref:hypothetical protein n=1 Tax=Halococcus saccharolyticus TaxID=62319 RepID=UPI00067823A4|nr:hypothetical protein [Halococcus saccharolyticus]
MAKWLRVLTKIHHYHHPVIGLCGLIATMVLYTPGTHPVAVGPLRLDAFYIAVAGFGALLVLSVIDEYDPEEYGLDPSNPEE